MSDNRKDFFISLDLIRSGFRKMDGFLSKSLISDNKLDINFAKKYLSYEKSFLPNLTHNFYKHFSSCFLGYGAQRLATKKYFSQLKCLEKINSKSGGKLIAEKIGLHPIKSFSSEQTWNEVAFPDENTDSIVIKPNNGVSAQDVFGLIKDDAGILDLFSSKRYKSFPDFKKSFSNFTNEKKWETEELVYFKSGYPGVDVKFFVFYGKISLILQIDRWADGGRQDYWFDISGNSVIPRDILHKKMLTYVDSPASIPLFNQVIIKDVEKASLKIPLPFCRIDYIFSDIHDFKFCEFTINAGGPNSFNNQWDLILGREYQSAAERLMIDVFEGKKFEGLI